MKIMAMILNGVVQNRIILNEADVDGWTCDPAYTLVDVTSQPTVDIGWLYDGSVFTPPAAQ